MVYTKINRLSILFILISIVRSGLYQVKSMNNRYQMLKLEVGIIS